jgi:hypothetical protein
LLFGATFVVSSGSPAAADMLITTLESEKNKTKVLIGKMEN